MGPTGPDSDSFSTTYGGKSCADSEQGIGSWDLGYC